MPLLKLGIKIFPNRLAKRLTSLSSIVLHPLHRNCTTKGKNEQRYSGFVPLAPSMHDGCFSRNKPLLPPCNEGCLSIGSKDSAPCMSNVLQPAPNPCLMTRLEKCDDLLAEIDAMYSNFHTSFQSSFTASLMQLELVMKTVTN